MGLETVELVMGFEEAFGIAIPDEDAARLETPRKVVEYVAACLPIAPAEGCRTRRAFHALRRGLRATGVAEVERLRPATRLRTLSDRASWPETWARVRAEAGEADWPETVPWSGFLGGGPSTLGQLARHVATPWPPPPGRPWTRERLELTVRRVVDDVTGIREFRMDDEFVRDLRLD